MSDYGTMKNRIANELARTDLTAYIPTAIQSAISHYERKRFFFNEGIDAFSTVVGQDNYGVSDGIPSDIKSIDLLEATVNSYKYRIEKRTYSYIRELNWGPNSFRHQPEEWAYYGDKIYIYPYPGQIYTMTISYLKKLSALSDDADTNSWMTEAEELIRQRAKADLEINVIRENQPNIVGNFLSPLEKIAFTSLFGETVDKVSSGKIRPTGF